MIKTIVTVLGFDKPGIIAKVSLGNIQINQSASKDEIFEMLDFYHESMGC